jgi:hypothetical protein
LLAAFEISQFVLANDWNSLALELGIVGLLLWLILVIFWFIFLVFFPMGYNSISFYQDFLVNAYFCILVGILYRLPNVALSAQFATVPASAPNRSSVQESLPVQPSAAPMRADQSSPS